MELKKYENIFIASKYDDIYEILKIVDIHATAYSTSGLEALSFGKPNIFINVGININDLLDVIDEKTSFIISEPQQFVKKMEHILSDYESVSKNALKISKEYFKPNAKQNIANFLTSIGIDIKPD